VKFRSTRILAIVTILSFSSLGFGQTTARTNVPSRPAQSAVKKAAERTPASTQSIESDMKEALGVIENNYVDGKKLDYNEVVKSSIDSALHTLDPHSNYFDAK